MLPTPPPAGTGAMLEMNSPLGPTTVTALLEAASSAPPETVVDHGCGWGEMLLRALEVNPGARGVGIDVHGPDIERAAAAASARGLADRVRFVQGSSADHSDPAELVINIGAFDALGTPAEALDRLRSRLCTGGRLVFGLEYWAQTPTDDELGLMWPDASVADCLHFGDLVDTIHTHGWRILHLHDSTRSEWDAFEYGHLREREVWLLDHPNHPVRHELDQAWTAWTRGRRRVLGFATFVLA